MRCGMVDTAVGIQTIVERQQCMPAECDDCDCLFLDRQRELWTAAFPGRSEDRSPTNDFLRHLPCTVFWLIPVAGLARALRLS